jgi:hypothetical protein
LSITKYKMSETIEWFPMHTFPSYYTGNIYVRWESPRSGEVYILTIRLVEGIIKKNYLDTNDKLVGNLEYVTKKFDYWAYAPKTQIRNK